MISEFSQKGLFTNRKTIIDDTKVIYQAFKNENEISIPYEDIATAHKENYTTQVKHIKLYIRVLAYLTGISSIMSIYINYINNLWIFFAIAFLLVIAFQLITQEKVWKIKLQNGRYIFINKKIPNEEEVNNFIDLLFEQRKKYLINTYLHINKNLEYESQLYNLQWLRKMNVLDNTEFDDALKELDILFNTEKKSIGF